MHLGFAERIVTPPTGTWLGGFSSRVEPSKGVRSDLYARVAWFESRGRRIVLIALDQVGVTRDWIDALYERLLENWGLRVDQVLINCTHTHCAPLYREPTPGFEHATFSPDYFVRLRDLVIDACEDAQNDLEPVALYFGIGSCDLAVSRRLIIDGQDVFAANPYGVVDHDVPVLAARRPDGSDKLILFSYACHPTMTNDLFFSSEYPGIARRVIENRVKGARTMFLQGCGADAVVGVHSSEKERYTFDDQWEDMEAAGRTLAWKVLLTLAHKMEPVTDDTLASSTWTCFPSFEHFPDRDELEARADSENLSDARWARYQLRRFSGEPVWPRNIEACFQGIRLGDVYIIGQPGEVVAAYGLRLKQRHPKLRLITLGYCHAQIGYIPRRSMYDEGGYEVDAWRTWGYPSRWNRNIEQMYESAADAVLFQLQQGH